MNDFVAVETTCPICKKTHLLEVRRRDLQHYLAGGLAQDCFPYLSADNREMIISGVCPACWDRMYEPDDED